MIVLVGVPGVGQVILRDGLQTSDRVARDLGNRMKEGFRGIAADTYLTRVLKARRRIGGPSNRTVQRVFVTESRRHMRPSSRGVEAPVQCCSSSLPSGKGEILSPP